MLDGSIRKIKRGGVCADAGSGAGNACPHEALKKKIYMRVEDRRALTATACNCMRRVPGQDTYGSDHDKITTIEITT